MAISLVNASAVPVFADSAPAPINDFVLPVRLNVGCGMSSTPGWCNFDNSLSVRLARHPWLSGLLARCGLLGPGQLAFVSAARDLGIRWADATRRIPLPDGSVEVVYCSHMLEHLDRGEVKSFLREVGRVLSRDGILRIAVPDLRALVDQYLRDGDADEMIRRTLLTTPKPRGPLAALKALLIGSRHHQWMYDGPSLVRLLRLLGFQRACVVAPGMTMIEEPGDLDLRERQEESVYVEAYAPAVVVPKPARRQRAFLLGGSRRRPSLAAANFPPLER